MVNISKLRKELDTVEELFGDIEVLIYDTKNNLPITLSFIDHVNDKFILVLDTYVEKD